MDTPIRVVVAKPGLDGYDRGAKVAARALRDAGMEVIYIGLHQTPEQIVHTAIAEDADAIGLSVLSDSQVGYFRQIRQMLVDLDADDIVMFGGGAVSEPLVTELVEAGVCAFIRPRDILADGIERVKAAVLKQRGCRVD